MTLNATVAQMFSLLLCLAVSVTRAEIRKTIARELLKFQMLPLMNPSVHNKLTNSDRQKLLEFFESDHNEDFYENADEEFAHLTAGKSRREIDRFMKKTAKKAAKKYVGDNDQSVLQLLLLKKFLGRNARRSKDRKHH